MRELLELPLLDDTDDDRSDGPREPEAELRRRLRAAVDRLSGAHRGDAVAALAEALGTHRQDRLDSFAGRAARRPDSGATTGAALYACAAEAVAAGEIGPASVGLVALLDDAATRQAALLGLAICAARAERPEEALALALSSREGEASHHPRALAVAAVAEHLRGRAAQAKLHLALAFRLARRENRFAPDARLVQRLLLAMQAA